MTHEAAYVASSPSHGPGSRLCSPAGGASQMTTHEEHVGLGRSPKGADGSAAVSTEGAGEGPESPRGPPKSKLGIGWLSGQRAASRISRRPGGGKCSRCVHTHVA